MLSQAEVKVLIDDLFEEEALVLGGLVAVHDLDDDLVWRLIKNLDVIRGKVMRRLKDSELETLDEAATQLPSIKPHPAIEDFLLKLRRAQHS